MQQNAISQLRDELSKLTGFLSPTPVKNSASQAVSFLNKKDNVYPITSPDSPLISVYSTIFSNSKLLKNYNQLLFRLVDCVRNNIFASESLLIVMNYINTNYAQFDVEPSLKLLQYTTSAILQDFPDLCIIKSFFSVSLALLAHPNPIVAGTAYASFQQMLALLVDSIIKFTDINSENYGKYLEYIKKEHGDVEKGFTKPLYPILHLLFCDLSSLSQKLSPSWLFAAKPPPDTLFVLLAEIVQTNCEILKADHQLLSSFQLTILEDVKYPNAIPYLITYMSAFLEIDTNAGSNIVSEYFRKIQYNAETNYVPIFFFHYFALQKGDIMLRYFVACEGALSLFVPLFCTFMNCLNFPQKPIPYQMKQWKHSDVLLNPQLFEIIAIHEITFALLSSFKKSENNKVIEFISKSVTVLVSLVVSGLKFSTIETFGVPQQALLDLCHIFGKFSLLNKIEDKFERFELLYHGINDQKRKLFLYDEKAKVWPTFLCKVIGTSPDICEDRWQFYIDAVITDGIPPTFANEYSNITAIDIIQAMVTTKPFPSEYLSGFINANINRFVILWPIVESYVDKMFRKKRFEESVFNFFISMMCNIFSQKTEVELLRMAETFLRSDISIQHKNVIMNQLKDNVKSSSSDIKEGWLSLFAAIHPLNFGNDKELVKMGFDIIGFVAYDFVDANSVPQCVDSIFSYVEQTVDDAISLFAFELLTKVSKRIENWDTILHKCSSIFTASRQAVAETAIVTFFNILQSGKVSQKMVNNLIEFEFAQYLNKFEDKSNIKSKIMIAAAEYACKNWQSLKRIPDFHHLFLPMLIDKHQKSTYNIIPFYLLFYQCADTTPEVEKLLSRSISSRVAPLADRNNQMLINSFGELISKVVKQRHVKISILNWMPILTKLALKMPANSINEAFASIVSLFPLEKVESIVVVENLSSVIARSDNGETRKLMINVLTEIVVKIPNLIFECKQAFRAIEAMPLVTKLLETNIENNSSAFECLSLVLCHKAVKQKVLDKIIQLFPIVDKDMQHQFIVAHSTDKEAIVALWKTYFDTKSPKFDQNMFNECKRVAVDAIKEFLAKWNDDEESLEEFLDFLQSVSVPKSEDGEDDDWLTKEINAAFSRIAASRSRFGESDTVDSYAALSI